ncbi:MAG: efflux RND transporter permease subunit [Planctomycetes bacterium]|jgi:HAE1 family hydrophobic/amphiphilic exporter-1|nr:efflux RND transporter permease subunit [Planctomycetota bacterium]MBT6452002.1 efflux RND transporter permease subunit [Planctomycetota bacterium]MBT6541698.1 efflux RND transporter permease subunit [Planctomycetota bacterium]MBT6785652.1 efflux RND transporter permease subunit [Planctomycetota bacterium]MBT6967226.1 efflux RND transporter permease subunit [Planctomycetota bacterium]
MENWLQGIIRRPVTVGMITIAAFTFGVLSLGRLPIELLPDITYPTLTVQTELPDASPQEVEQLVTEPIEDVVGVVQGLRRYISESRAGVSEVVLEFSWDTDMQRASLDVREKLDLVNLPDDARAPLVFRFDPSLDPMMRLALTGSRSVADLRKLAELRVKRSLETLDGVAAARVIGGAEDEVLVNLDSKKLDILGISVQNVAQRLAQENVNRSGGEIRDQQTAYRLRTVNEFQSLEDIEDVIVRHGESGTLRVRDIGTAAIVPKDEEILVRVNGKPAVQIDLYKEGDANAVSVAKGVRARLETIVKDRSLSGCEMEILADQARFIEDSIASVESTAMVGAMLAALVLFLFLRNMISTLTIALSIPISVAVTFLLMELTGVSINVLSLGGLALGIGMLVDNSVVVLESIQRLRDDGVEMRTAVTQGTSQVMGGIIASTLTTIAVFLPLIFVQGIGGEIFRDQALTVTYSLLASLFVAITVIPTIIANGSSGGKMSKVFEWIDRCLSPISSVFAAGMKAAQNSYARMLDRVLEVSWVPPVLALGLCFAILPRATELGSELVPDLFQGQFYFDVELSEGTPLEETDRKVAALEHAIDRLREEGLPIGMTTSIVGDAPVLGEVQAGDRREHVARVSVSLNPEATRVDEEQVIARIIGEFNKVPDCPYTLGRPSLFTFRDPIEIEVFDEDLDLLRFSALAIEDRLELVPGLLDVQAQVADQVPEVHVRLDPVKISAYGLSLEQIANGLRAKGIGEVATQYRFAEKPIDIRVRMSGALDKTLSDVEMDSVTLVGDGIAAPLRVASLGRLEQALGPVEIRRIGGERSVLVTARTDGIDLGTATERAESVIHGNYLPPSSSAQMSGQNQEMKESLTSLAEALALAVFVVYLVLASTFESLLLPFIVIFTVPLGICGAIIAMFITGIPLGVLSMIGVILLCGIVVNNGIIFVARIQQLRQQGHDPSMAARTAGSERLRPILITSATTILGLMPLALGLGPGAELRKPLAITVVWGLAMATVMTLAVIPTGYRLLQRSNRSGDVS